MSDERIQELIDRVFQLLLDAKGEGGWSIDETMDALVNLIHDVAICGDVRFDDVARRMVALWIREEEAHNDREGAKP